MEEAIVVQSAYEIERNKPIPSKNHAIIQGNLYFLLRQYYGDLFTILLEISSLLDKKERVPDIGIYQSVKFTPGNDEVKLTDLPLAVIEILSPKQHLADLISKSHGYFEAGVQSYWLVLPDLKTIYVYNAPNEYEVYAKTETLKDEHLNIELSLKEVFK